MADSKPVRAIARGVRYEHHARLAWLPAWSVAVPLPMHLSS